MLHIIVLGAAAGGGVPQWNCGCPQCAAARRDPALALTQASLAISADQRNWFLINASPDLRQQLNATPALHPRDNALRDSPIAGVVLTNGEVDAIAGLLNLREKTGFGIYAHPRVLDILDANPIFEVLDRQLVRRHGLPLDRPIALTLPDGAPSGIDILAYRVPGKVPLYLEDAAAADDQGDTIGLEIRCGDAVVQVVTACAAPDGALLQRLRGASMVLFDGTLWRDDELIAAGLGQKTGTRMGHMSMSGETGSMAVLDPLEIGRKIFIHINNSNPVLHPASPERAELERRGWTIPADGMEFTL
jgi:pyrroloquinoline quinone biosynthesis protein B